MQGKDRGNALVTVVMTLAVILILCTGFLSKSVHTHRIAWNDINETQADMVAKSILDGMIEFFETNYSESKKLIGKTSSNLIEFVDGQQRVWNGKVEIEEVVNAAQVKIIVDTTSPNKKYTGRAVALLEYKGSTDASVEDNQIYMTNNNIPNNIDPEGYKVEKKQKDLSWENFKKLTKLNHDFNQDGIYEWRKNSEEYGKGIKETFILLKAVENGSLTYTIDSPEKHYVLYCESNGGAIKLNFSGQNAQFYTLDIYAPERKIDLTKSNNLVYLDMNSYSNVLQADSLKDNPDATNGIVLGQHRNKRFVLKEYLE